MPAGIENRRGVSRLRHDLLEAISLLGADWPPSSSEPPSTPQLTSLLYERCFARARPATRPAPDDDVLVTLVAATLGCHHATESGWFVVRASDHGAMLGPLARLYWNVRSAGAGPLLELLVGELAGRVPFTAKVPSDRLSYGRIDAGIVYVPRAAFGDVTDAVRRVHGRLDGLLDDATPLFTKRLLPGLAVADDPGGGRSFGLHRCGLVAARAGASVDIRAARTEDLACAVENRLRRRGISPARPYLNPGATSDFALNPPAPLITRAPTNTVIAADRRPPAMYVERASDIGRALCGGAAVARRTVQLARRHAAPRGRRPTA